MINTLFLQSESPDPYQLYERILNESPVFWDNTNKLWAVYSHKNCKEILSDPAAQIPPVNDNNSIAENFSINMTKEALADLFEKNKTIRLAEKNILYEPLINLRLPKNIYISVK